jgi:O-antigen/teichoic acid export membrane protein
MMEQRMWIKKLLNNKVAKNASWLIAARIVQMGVNLIVGLLTARYLGPSNYGLINYGKVYTSFFLSICNLGINSVIVKELVDQPEKDGVILGTSLGLKALSSFISAITILILVSFIDTGDTITFIVVAACCLGMLFNVLDTFNYWFQARLQSKVTAIATLTAYIITSIYKIYLLITGKGVVCFALASAVDYAALGAILYAMYRKYQGGSLRVSVEYSKKLLKKSVPYILPGLMISVYGQTDKFMLKQMISDAEIGYYATAVYVCEIWCFILTAIIDSMQPDIMAAYHRSKEEFDYKNKLLYGIVFYLSMIASAFIALFSKYIVLILYGEAYLPAAAPLRIITWYTAFSYLGVARNAWIVCNDCQKYLKYVYVSAAISNVILNRILIPVWGSSGAALASLIAQILTTMVVPFVIKPLRENSKLMLEAILLKGIKK